MDVRAIEVGEPKREHEIERTTQPAQEPLTVPERRPVELPDPATAPTTPSPTKVPA